MRSEPAASLTRGPRALRSVASSTYLSLFMTRSPSGPAHPSADRAGRSGGRGGGGRAVRVLGRAPGHGDGVRPHPRWFGGSPGGGGAVPHDDLAAVVAR